MGNWHFITLPKEEAAEIKAGLSGPRRGFGSVPVMVTVGETVWKTSIFPDNSSKSYLLPIKAAVRKKEDIEAGEMVTVTISLV